MGTWVRRGRRCTSIRTAADATAARRQGDSGAAGRPHTWAASAGHAGSSSTRAYSTHCRHGPSPGTTTGPSRIRPSPTTSDRCGVPRRAHADRSAGSTTWSATTTASAGVGSGSTTGPPRGAAVRATVTPSPESISATVSARTTSPWTSTRASGSGRTSTTAGEASPSTRAATSGLHPVVPARAVRASRLVSRRSAQRKRSSATVGTGTTARGGSTPSCTVPGSRQTNSSVGSMRMPMHPRWRNGRPRGDRPSRSVEN
ncbi:hypothetical protein NI26_04315 [Curtobacterium sp. MR_MD2014]|nr:hypothetical protein NI26_04315 [Curtobacterium sp. MR_MD2014]